MLEKFLKRRKISDGTKASPASTCQDLFRENSAYDSGNYWIDPDGGTLENAIFVYCNRQTNATCLQPEPTKFENVMLQAGDWLSENNFIINYKSYGKQTRYLQLYSSKATQDITIRSTSKVINW